MKNYTKTMIEPGLIAFYDIQPGNGVGLFLQPCSLHGAADSVDYASKLFDHCWWQLMRVVYYTA